MERLNSPSNYPPSVGKFRDEQIATRRTWSRVPDAQTAAAAMHVIHVIPAGASTVTHLNPLDPGTVADAGLDNGDAGLGWLERPADPGRLLPAGRR